MLLQLNMVKMTKIVSLRSGKCLPLFVQCSIHSQLPELEYFGHPYL